MPVLQFENLIIQIALTFAALTGISKSVVPEALCTLPNVLKENSGMVAWGDTLLWFINDSGNQPKLYAVNTRCEIVKEVWVNGAENVDWEDMAQDKEGNIFIGDIGNNSNKRKTLVIYKISKADLLACTDSVNPVVSICFFYKNQDKYPPDSDKKYFDAEALFFYNDSLSLITKNRTYPFDGKAYYYRIPAESGHYALMPADSLFTGLGLMELHWISGADIWSDNHLIAIGYDKLFLIEIDKFEKTISIGLGRWDQFESVASGERYIYISNEKNKKNKATLYRIDKKTLEFMIKN
ncbi:MAG: hypothetical protein ACK4KT_08995 [Thermaurantimonas sp.]